MFRKLEKKIVDTDINRQRILDMAQDKNKCFGLDKNGVVSYAQIELDGTQLWAEVNPATYKIRNCGINKTGEHRPWNINTGFKLEFKNR